MNTKNLISILLLVAFMVTCHEGETVATNPIDEIETTTTTITYQLVAAPAVTSFNSMDVELADFNNDGNLDIVVAGEFATNLLLIGDGKGGFILQGLAFPAKTLDSEDIALGDFDGDDDLDVIFVSEDDFTNEYYLNNGDLTFTDNSENFPIALETNAIDVGDVNQDGNLDLIVASAEQNRLLINDGKGNFTDETPTRLPALQESTQDIEFGDIDNDTDLDILVSNEDETPNYLLVNDGSGVFVKRELPTPTSAIEETREADFGDINGDGFLDIFNANVQFTPNQNLKDPANRILINDGTGHFTDETAQRFDGPNNNFSLDGDFVDLDDDGDMDLVIATFNGNGHQVMINENGVLVDKTKEYLPNAAAGVDVEVGDFNNDGKLDFYFSVFQGIDQLFLSVN